MAEPGTSPSPRDASPSVVASSPKQPSSFPKSVAVSQSQLRSPSPSPKTPPPHSWGGSNAKNKDLQNDPRYKKYIQLVERNLQSFDNVNEWADVNPFLLKIMRSFQAYPQYTVIPRSLTVAKRLAQCLNPALPAGVHGKTLDVYAYILETIGPDQLAEDITLWSYGLFPFLQYAALSVKPQLLDIYEKFYLPLKERLKPCLKSFMIGLLPGLDEEGSEFFDRVLNILDNLRKNVDETFFFQCMWLILITSSQHRGPALHYLGRRMPMLTNTEDVAFVLGDDAGLMVRAFSATVGDSQLLVQRAMLDLMVVHFPISNGLIEQNDLIVLVKAAVGVVLRKDMSLNRRLYAWLLGSQEGKKKVFDGPAKSALIVGLQSILLSEGEELHESQKPYRVFVSLLDEWDIGYPVIQAVFLDALMSLKRHVVVGDHGAELIQTATMWIDMTDPYLIWKKLSEAIYENFPAEPGKESYALDLVIFFLNSFKLNDEEMQHLHIPMFLLFLLTRIQGIISENRVLLYADQVNNALSLCLMLFRHIPASVFAPQANQLIQAPQPTRAPKSKPSTPATTTNKGESNGPAAVATKVISFEPGMSAKDYIEEFFMLVPQKTNESESTTKEYAGINGQALRQQALTIIQNFISNILDACMADDSRTNIRTLRTMIQKSCKILSILSRYQTPSSPQNNFSGPWLDKMRLACHKTEDFAMIDALLSTIVELTVDLKVVEHSFVDNQEHMKAIVDRLWTFFAEEYMQLHLRVSQLIWMLQDVTSLSHEVETAIASYLVVDNAKSRVDAFQKFGVFWRLSDDIQHNSTAFVRPMMLMLDSLSSTNPSNRRAGETWIRSNLKSYPRLLDPLLFVLFDHTIVRNKSEETFHNEYFPVHYYIRNFNQAQVQYVFNTLLTVFRFGGLGFLRSIRQSTIPIDMVSIMTDIVGVSDSKTPPTYLDCFVKSALRFIESEPTSDYKSMLSLNEEIHMVAADFLHFIISKIDHVDTNLLAMIHKTVINKMLYCINHGRLDLQSRLLHLLHATILMGTTPVKKPTSANSTTQNGSLPRDSSISTFEGATGHSQSTHDAGEGLFRVVGSSPLFVKTVFDALSVPTNRPILQHWMDFLMLALPFLTNYFRRVLLPVIQCLCDQILRSRASLIEAYTDSDRVATGSPNLTDQDLMIFLTGLERLLTFSLAEARLGEEVDPVHKQEWSDGLRGTQGLVANVLSIEVHPSDSFQENKARDTVLYNIVSIIQVFVELWSAFDSKAINVSETDDVSLQFIGERARARVKRILAGLYKAYPSEVTEAFVELFLAENLTVLDLENTKSESDYRTLDILSTIPGASPLAIFLTLLESTRARTQGMSTTRSKRPNLRISKASDIVLLRFMEIYCTYLPSAESLIDLWPMCLNFVREYFPQATTYKYAFPSLLRIMTVLCDRLSHTSYFDDKKIRRDASDLYQRVLDYCVLIAGRSFDQGIWLRNRNPQDFEIMEESDDSRESVRPPSSSMTEVEQARRAGKTKEDVLIQQILVSLCQLVIPNLRRILQEQDRITTALTNLMYYVIAPSLKSRVGINDSSVDLLCEISKIPFAYRTWRKEVWEVFLDNRFFAMGPAVARKWRQLIQTAMTSEKERLVELLGRISTSPTSALFTSRDQESLNRALMLRRLTFVIWCGTVDQYLPQLPNIQEKLVELLKLSSTEQVHPEIYLCLRVLLCRISNQHLNNFWPVLLTELIQLFNLFLTDENDRPEQVSLFLSACKFLDLLFVLENGLYFIHQWIFISDAIRQTVMHSPMGEAMPHALMDRLGKKLFEEAPLEGYASANNSTSINSNTMLPEDDRWLTENDILQQMSFGSQNLASSAGSNLSLPLSASPTLTGPQSEKSVVRGGFQQQQQSSSSSSSRALKRPMLTMRSIQHVRELEFFLSHVAQYVYHTTYTLAKPDTKFIEALIERDMLGGSSIEE
ncbi:Dopey, N-terminal-domain-containing protein [Linnemannia elongata]|nr:Dopey, N-terminal-domain-containing protein [Linnemannia elongata]